VFARIPALPRGRSTCRRRRSNPRSQSSYISDHFASSFDLFTLIGFQTLLVRSRTVIFISMLESFSTLLIASFLDRISFVFFFHKLYCNWICTVEQSFARRSAARIEHDMFATHICLSRKAYRLVCQTRRKGLEALRHLDVSSRRKHGIQGGVSPSG
jgi:hypothetical protein